MCSWSGIFGGDSHHSSASPLPTVRGLGQGVPAKTTESKVCLRGRHSGRDDGIQASEGDFARAGSTTKPITWQIILWGTTLQRNLRLRAPVRWVDRLFVRSAAREFV